MTDDQHQSPKTLPSDQQRETETLPKGQLGYVTQVFVAETGDSFKTTAKICETQSSRQRETSFIGRKQLDPQQRFQQSSLGFKSRVSRSRQRHQLCGATQVRFAPFFCGLSAEPNFLHDVSVTLLHFFHSTGVNHCIKN